LNDVRGSARRDVLPTGREVNPLLARDLKILCMLLPQGKSIRSLDLASTVASVSGLW
jgi:hypothetical protein